MMSSGAGESASDLLVRLRSRGIKIWGDNGRLRYQAPKGSLTHDDVEKLGAAKAALIELLQQASPNEAVERQITPRLPSDRIPLTFTQKFWWTCLRLEKCPSMRSVAGAVHVTGQLSFKHIHQCFSELVRRHESLRTRIVTIDGVPWQVVDEPGEYHLECRDLGRSPVEEHAVQIRELVEQLTHEPFSVAAGPLFTASLIKLGDKEHVLVVAMDHIISDAASLGIVWREILAMYAQSIQGRLPVFPHKSIQFADYAVWQQRTNQSWKEQHETYWRKRLTGATRARALENDAMSATGCTGWRRQPVHFPESVTERLRTLCHEKKTSIAMITLTVYTAFLLRRSAAADIVIAFVTLGRPQPKLENTIGYFSTSLFLRVEMPEGASFFDVLDRVTEEYSTAYQHTDCGRVAAQHPTPEFAWNPRFNWIPREFAVDTENSQSGIDSSISLRVEPYELDVLPRDDIEWDGDFEMVTSAVKDQVSGFICYRTDRFAALSIERFARNFELFAGQVVKKPWAPLP